MSENSRSTPAPGSSPTVDRPVHQIMAAECLSSRVRLLSRAITAIYDDVGRPFGLKATQAHVLVAVAMLPDTSPTEVCRWLQMDASTLSRTLERLGTRGWVETLPDAGDGRTHRLRLTPEGDALLTDLYPAWQEAQGRAAELLGEGGDAALRGLADAVWAREFENA